MISTHEDLSAIEASFGPEKAAPLINALEKLEREQRVEVKKDLLMELATKADIANLRADIEDRLVKLETLLKVLIGLVIVAISFFSPLAAELIKLIK